ncbi:TPA: sel1 repeat family protein [Legionella pneumophila]|nr:sel1 repeat family protein [Legionella pneumophila]HAU1319631.1 sel1 repeat family protein [Legionella pneumophila]HBC0466255.1 sel1 repeat family protein [Legionella pneumophila]HBD9373421.1 sel1 repeat family protein [Legionella pneumophila]HBI2945252.1 sel1 repeat family protein [Legionella pneumophila]
MQRIFKLFILIIFIPMMAACITGTLNLREGIQCFKAQDYRKAFIRLKPEAQKGNPDAQYAVGYMYYYGKGVVEDRKKARFWITCAARAGQPDAIVALGILDRQARQDRRLFEDNNLQHFPVDNDL